MHLFAQLIQRISLIRFMDEDQSQGVDISRPTAGLSPSKMRPSLRRSLGSGSPESRALGARLRDANNANSLFNSNEVHSLRVAGVTWKIALQALCRDGGTFLGRGFFQQGLYRLFAPK
jgi:hypothetical protein